MPVFEPETTSQNVPESSVCSDYRPYNRNKYKVSDNQEKKHVFLTSGSLIIRAFLSQKEAHLHF